MFIPFVEIARFFRSRVLPQDRDDVEQDIIIELIKVTRRKGDLPPEILRFCAKCVYKRYWIRKYREWRRTRHLRETGKGEMVTGEYSFVSQDGDFDAQIDASAVLATLPKRLVELGYKRLNGERLSEADEWYWMRHKAKLDCRQRGDQFSDWGKRRVMQLHKEGLSVSKIARCMDRSRRSIDLCLVKAKLREAPPYLASRQ